MDLEQTCNFCYCWSVVDFQYQNNLLLEINDFVLLCDKILNITYEILAAILG